MATFTTEQVTFLDRYLVEKGKQLIEFISSPPDESGHDLSDITDKVREFINVEGLEILKETPKKKKKKKKEEQDVSVEDTDDEDGGKKTKKKGKTKKEKTEKKPSKITGYRLYMFGIKDDDEKLGKIKEIKNSDALDEFKEDKSSGEIHKKAFSMASASWKELDDDEKKVFNDKAKEINSQTTEE